MSSKVIPIKPEDWLESEGYSVDSSTYGIATNEKLKKDGFFMERTAAEILLKNTGGLLDKGVSKMVWKLKDVDGNIMKHLQGEHAIAVLFWASEEKEERLKHGHQ